ncbi:hypothetical protein PoB_005008700 [Plakobranchus ocellatus]|uniref:Uncharacterized protein n=1 Tax=Plakobranchus ocellatus TaxID=259542 RepID=A0AAV4BWY4_9GAST|nr:hypothetical protein PoB_005008700 [Plakobranchus ocellatus]
MLGSEGLNSYMFSEVSTRLALSISNGTHESTGVPMKLTFPTCDQHYLTYPIVHSLHKCPQELDTVAIYSGFTASTTRPVNPSKSRMCWCIAIWSCAGKFSRSKT